MKTKTGLLAAITTLAMAGYSAAGLADPPPHAKWAPLEGTWAVTIHPTFCTAEPPL